MGAGRVPVEDADVPAPDVPGTRDTDPVSSGRLLGHHVAVDQQTELPGAPAYAAEDRHLGRLAGVLAALAVSCCLAAVLVGAGDQRLGIWIGDVVLGSVWPLVGALVVRSQPRNPVGWLLLVPGLLGPYLLAGTYAASTGGEGPLGVLAGWYATWGFAPYFFTLPVLPHVFPDGRPLSRAWGRVLALTVGVGVVTTVARMFSYVETDPAPEVINPFGVESAGWLRYVTATGSISLFFLFMPLAVISLFLRRRSAVEPARSQLSWLFLGGIALVLGMVVPLGSALEPWGLTAGLLAFPVAIGVGMLRYRLFDADFALNRTIVLGVLTALVVAVYVAVVYGAQAVAPGSRLGVLLVAVLALLAAVGRDRLQRFVDRRLFGHRHDPYAVVSHVGRGVAGASDPDAALRALVEGVRESLRLPYAAFVPPTGAPVVSGEPVHGSRSLAALALGVEVGRLEVGRRERSHRWTPAEEQALEEVVARAGTLAYAAALVGDVSRSRERIVAAREEERRRMRADLHDGVAPSLAGTALQLESMARRLSRAGEDELADRALGLRDGLRGTVGELRSLVHGLRPPVLDQRGLAGAVRELVAGIDEPACTARVEDVGVPHAAVEVAAYAIAAEGFANALRHASASHVEVGLRAEEGVLVVSVRDDGTGLPDDPVEGVGLGSMRDRAAEVGGHVWLGPAVGGGTLVEARLPLAPVGGAR